MQASLLLADYVVLVLYLLIVVAVGVWFSRGDRDTEAYLLGGRRIPWAAVALSYFVSVTSTLSMVGIPGEAYTYGVAMGLKTFITPFAVLTCFFIFIRFFFYSRIFTPFTYLEHRFDGRVRALAAGIFAVTRLTYIALVLYSCAKVFEGAAQWPVWLSIVLIGLVGTIYTVLGGIRAVVWTDVIQFVIMAVGLLLIVIKVIATVPGGAGGIVEYAIDRDHFLRKPEALVFSIKADLGDELNNGVIAEHLRKEFEAKEIRLSKGAAVQMSKAGIRWSITDEGETYAVVKEDNDLKVFREARFWSFSVFERVTLWLVILSAFAGALFNNTGDQLAVQRLLTTSGYKQARRAMITQVIVDVPMMLSMWFVGLAVWVFYQHQAAEARPKDADLAMMNFVTAELPQPLPGLIVAALLAAVMSTLDSGINSLATVFTKDFYLRFFRKLATELEQVRIARWMTVATGLFAIAVAMLISHVSETIRDKVLEVTAVWMASQSVLPAAFILAAFSRRATARHVLIALVIGEIVVVGMMIWYLTAKFSGQETMSPFYVGGAGIVVPTVVGFVLSRFAPRQPNDALRNMTFWTLKKNNGAVE